MALTQEWNNRLKRWKEELKKHFILPLGPVPVEAAYTLEHLPFEKAMALPFAPVTPGTTWGKKWQYGWFRSEVSLPAEAEGKQVVILYDMGGEALLYVDGKTRAAFSWAQNYCVLAEQAKAGDRFQVAAEAYAGHGRMWCGEGPVPLTEETVPEPKDPSTAVKEAALAVFDEDAFQLWIDVMTLWELRENMDKNSLRVSEIDAGLRDFTLLTDFELPLEEMQDSFRKARARLTPLLKCKNGSTAPDLFAFGHAHLDVAWLWPLAETERKAARTLSTQLWLAEKYPGYRFLHSQAHLFRFVKTLFPELYERVKKAVKSGGVIAEGGMWVEADTNITGGESLIRQFIHGKRYFKEEFGVESVLMWLPDVFGYSANMPQIMKGCGIKYFSTCKIFWTYNGGETFPHNTFWWEGIDGSKSLVHIHNDYNSQMSPAHVIQRWNERVQKDAISSRLMPFGWGDGGGGPTREHLEYATRARDHEGMPRVRMSSPVDYFTDLEKRGVPDITYVGELYFQAHRGTYTSQAKTKKGNRKSELALREAELWGVAARALKGFAFSAQDLDESWKGVLLCQFHDILPGSSIHRVYEEAEALHARVIAQAHEIVQKAAGALAKPSKDAVTVMNALSWNRQALVDLPAGFEGAALPGSAPLPVQKEAGRTRVLVTVPSCGWVTLHRAAPATAQNGLLATTRLLENSLLKITFNEKGEIAGIYDKETKREMAAGLCNSFKMYKDVPSWFDAWDLDSQYKFLPVELPADAKIEVLSAGPLEAAIKITRTLNNSEMVQEVSLAAGSRRIDFRTRIEWKERHKVLKVAFPVAVHANEAVHEIQMGHLRRPNHQSRPFDADRFEVCNHKWTALCEESRGCAVLNDCKYGVNVDGNSINLTLLKAPLAPDMTADLGTQEFTYSFYAWNTSFDKSGCITEAYDLNVPVQVVPGDAGTRSLFSVDAPGVIIETVKPAEDGSGDIVVRLYESLRNATKCLLSTTLPVLGAQVTDMLETRISDLPVTGNAMTLDFRPFEIKTLRLRTGS